MTYNNAPRSQPREVLRDTRRYQSHSSSLACSFPLALTHRWRGKAQGFTTSHPHDSPLTWISQKRVGVERRGETTRVHTRANNARWISLSTPWGTVLGRRSISHVACDDKTLRTKWPVHLGPAKPAIHSAEPRVAPRRAVPRRHTREKDAKLEH